MIDNTVVDEDTFVMPDAWRRVRHPRRDRPDVPSAPALVKDAVERVRSLVDAVRDDIDVVLGLPGTESGIAEAARGHLRGEPDPLGAAAVAYVTAPLNEMEERSAPPPDRLFVDALVAEHGVAFAARACVEWAGIHADNPANINQTGLPFRLATAQRRAELRSMTLRRKSSDEMLHDWWLTRTSGRGLRARLAAAPDDVYAEAVDSIAGVRRHPLQKVLAAYLAPTRDDWVEDLWARPGEIAFDRLPPWLPLCALGRAHQPAMLGQRLRHDCRRDVVATLLDGVGVDAVVPLLIEALDNPYLDTTDELRTILEFFVALPGDEAFQALVDRIDRPEVVAALMAAARRFPVRAMRLLPGAAVAEPLSAHVRANPGIAAEVARGLPAEQRAAIQEILDANVRLPQTTDVPCLLTEPPWTRPRAKTTPVVIKDLPAPGARAITWAPGERESWAAPQADLWDRRAEGVDFAERAAAVEQGHAFNVIERPTLFLRGPVDLVRPLVRDWEPSYAEMREVHEWLGPLVARHETDACGPVLAVVRRDPGAFGHYTLPLLSDEIARTMADWLVRLKAGAETARAWFRRHGTAAAPCLIPDALGKAGPTRRAAEAALRLIADGHGPEPIVAAARVHGERAAAAIEALLSTDPLDDLPRNVPVVDWADPRVLPQILVRDRERALPDEAAGHVLTMLAMSKPGDAYAGVRIVRDLCDPASLAEFGWALFRWWEVCGAPAKENWAFTQLALTGDDETVRRLTPVIRAWPGNGGHAKAVTGLDVLAAIGTDTALLHLHSISQRVKFTGLKTRAQEKISELAAELGLSAEQLADRLVPDFGLDASGTLTLDYGPRRFVIGFDELLRPTIADADGTPRKSLPKPGAKDDPELAPAAYERFTSLKKDVRTVAADRLARFETAMITTRHWPVAEFREFLVAHPLTGHLVRRLVWLAEDGPAFRVAEDGTFADAADDTVTLPETARVAVAHPVHLGDETKAWSRVFADYEILQPFDQLARPVHALTDKERETGRLTRFEGRSVPIGDILGLVRRGWERGGPMDAGIEWWISRHVAPDLHLVVTYDYGITIGAPDEMRDQTFKDVRFAVHPDRYTDQRPAAHVPGDLNPALISEALADLTRVTTPTTETA
ncbi:uncharacterized protein DUF4132 [Actinomadura pelletieri DSM 43383]|uniref:Uncharacterized protein DUF4132 n=1 Tax=Actinomadura pelletieri DSM 43383 TaxID=1120940 RepID=A0A495QTY5_9ACTN|nr:DUF4132 domain-containing protein [Actinomadura pelletieri]RKS76915.1 uncharacterized protein DUF4132 [Actinomadura pelletieri DSM 43383]